MRGLCTVSVCGMAALSLAPVLLLTGCASLRADDAPRAEKVIDQASWVEAPDFGWHLSGDRRVAPRQVFSGSGRVWIQWHPHQAVPTLFVQAEEGPWRLVAHRQQGQYTIIEGDWPRLRFQGGPLVAYATHRGDVVEQPLCQPGQSQTSVGQRQRFEARVSDRTIRQALNRWATEHHWYFEDAHWALPHDFPVTAPAVFEGDFAAAVDQLLAAVEVSGQPVRACFYANHVLRVIPGAQSCDPSGIKGDR